MPELNLYMTEKDERRAVTFAFEQGCEFIPDLHYPSNRYELISTTNQYLRCRVRTRLFFILSEKYYCCPLEMRRIQQNGRRFHYISQRSGGPTIQFLAGGSFEAQGQEFIRSGAIGYYPTYWNTLESEMQKPSARLVSTYKSLALQIRQIATRIKLGRSIFWVGDDARRAALTGAKLVGFEKFEASEIITALGSLRDRNA
jgi:hypothetical protein